MTIGVAVIHIMHYLMQPGQGCVVSDEQYASVVFEQTVGEHSD